MDGFNDGFTSSTSIKPNSSYQGNYEDDLVESMAFKLMIADKKRRISTPVSSASKAAVPKRNVSAVRSETLDGEEQHFLLRSLSFDSKYSRDPVFYGHDDVKNSLVVDSQFQPYDPIKNYLSPRPRYLRYDPSRHHEIFARQERVSRVRRSASFDSRMHFAEEESKSNGDCSLGSSSQEEFVEEKEEIIESSVGKDEDEHEEELEEEFEDYEEDNGWISNVFLQYFLVTIAVILTTLIISSMNSPTPSPAREAIWGFIDLYSKTHSRIYQTVGLIFSEVGYEAFAPMMLIVGKFREVGYGNEEWDKKGLVVNTGELVEGLEIAETEELVNNEIDVNQDEESPDQLEGLGTAETNELENNEIDVNQDVESSDQLEGLETAETNETDVDQDEEGSNQLQGSEINENEEVEIKETDNQLQDPAFPISKEIENPHEIEPKKESFGHFLSEDSNCIDAREELGSVKMMVEEDVVGKQDSNNCLYENDIEERETTDFLIKLASFDPISTASIGLSVLILTSLSVLYYSKNTEVSPQSETTIACKNSTDRKNLEPFVNSSHSAYRIHSASLMLNPIENEVSKAKDSNFSLAFTQSDAFSSSKRKSSHLELSTGDSLSGGSFTVEKKIVKKQKSKNPEVMLSTVRRSSRIHSRSVMSP